ncbi:MAG: helix-hairpin-helix domain-containing protein [Deltaproteobacteria bacterium]|nr:helix-hairpin-helix domain-containing protein [Deltaproteobacteria bacterium]
MRSKLIRRFWRRLPALVFATLSFAACDGGLDPVESIRPGWTANQEFHLETSYNKVPMRTERGDRGHDVTSDDGAVSMDLDDAWTEPVFWRYQVIRTSYSPAEGEDLFEYADKGGEYSSLTVIKASLDPAMNIDHELSETDPKIYMVIREDRLRLAGLVTFYTINGERSEEAITVDDEDIHRSFSRLSQTNLAMVPHFIPPFPLASVDRDLVLEDGQEVSFTNSTGTGVDVVYENSMDDTLIAETWEEGQPWATWSITPTIESRLMTSSEVDAIRGGTGGTFDNHDDPDDESYVDLLRAPFNLNESLYVTDEMIGTNTHTVGVGRKPWAGSWWSQAKGRLVWGIDDSGADFNGLVTLSHLAKDKFRSPATDIQNLGDELRNIRKDEGADSEAYTTKVDEYREKQKELVDELVRFYNAVRAGIDGGQITMEKRGDDWFIKGDENWNNASEEAKEYGQFDININRLSPLDKFSLLQQTEGHLHGTNPWFGPAWELLNHWSPAGSAWFGHCNGWAAAAILDHEPREMKTFDSEWGSSVQGASDRDFTIELSVADQKGWLSETNYSGLSNFFGARYNDEEDDVNDLSPKAVLQILGTYIKQRGVPLVFDTTATDQVWNFPAWEYELTLTETTAGGAGAATGLININTAGIDQLTTLWGISTVRAQRTIQYRQDNGPFQTTEEIIDVRGIGRGIFNRISDQITVSQDSQLREFDGTVKVKFTTDGVAETYIDTNQESPNSFVDTYEFTLEASPNGEIINSTWDDPEKHPDFAWVPYANTVRSGSSENPYLQWTNVKDYLGDDIVRE